MLDHAVRELRAAEVAPRKVRREVLPQAEAREAHCREHVESLRAELAQMPPVRHEARAELAVTDLVLAERCREAITAAKLAPPAYIVGKLGERPSDPEKRRAWDKGVAGIERYRQEHGITDRDNALGKKPTGGIERSSWTEQRSRLAEQQQRLQRERVRGANREMGHDLGQGMEMGF